jgi:hypothetical protein
MKVFALVIVFAVAMAARTHLTQRRERITVGGPGTLVYIPERPLNNVTAVQLVKVVGRKAFCNVVTGVNDVISWTDVNGSFTMSVPQGAWTTNDLVSYINGQFTNFDPGNPITLNYFQQADLMTITVTLATTFHMLAIPAALSSTLLTQTLGFPTAPGATPPVDLIVPAAGTTLATAATSVDIPALWLRCPELGGGRPWGGLNEDSSGGNPALMWLMPNTNNENASGLGSILAWSPIGMDSANRFSYGGPRNIQQLTIDFVRSDALQAPLANSLGVDGVPCQGYGTLELIFDIETPM